MPFFAATYLPADASRGFLGLKQLVVRVQQIWANPEEKENVIAQAGKIVDIFSALPQEVATNLPNKEHIKNAADLIYKSADPLYGGIRGAPKFPVSFQASFLLRQSKASKDSRALFYVEKTLEMMARGGIYDHLGGGFSRYSVDEQWLIPHFEKMLYDNALLAHTYFELWHYTKNSFYKDVGEQILNFVTQELTDSGGGFYSAMDADSQGQEGAYYTWTNEEIHSILGVDAAIFCDYYDVRPSGNFEGRSILHTPLPLQEFAKQAHLDPERLLEKIKENSRTLLEARKKRPSPLVDDKILTSWNGLMISAFAEAGRSTGNDRYLAGAERAALFIKEHLMKEGQLLRRYREGEARFDGCLDDYAFMIQAALSLFEADRGAEWLEFALRLTNSVIHDFKAPNGAFYLTNGKDPYLLIRRCEFYDGAEPSGNAVLAENFVRLYQITGIEDYLRHAESILKAAKHNIELYPPGSCYHLLALQRILDIDAPTLVITLNDKEENREAISEAIRSHFIPHKVTIWKREKDEELRDLSPFARDKGLIDGKTTLHICHRNRCKEPLTDIHAIRQALETL